MNDVNLFTSLLANVANFDFLPAIASTAAQFGWDVSKAAVCHVAPKHKARSRMNLVSSVLHESTNTPEIHELLQLVDVKPPRLEVPKVSYSWRKDPVDRFMNPTTEDFARILALVFRASPNKLTEYLHHEDDRTVLKLIAPALVQFVKTTPASPGMSSAIDMMRQRIQSRLPSLQNAEFSAINIGSHCDKCSEMDQFLKTETMEQTTIAARNKTQLKHIQAVIKRFPHKAKVFVNELPPTMTLQLTKQFLQDDELTKAAHEMLASLGKLGVPVPSSPMVSDVPPVPSIQIPVLQPNAALTPRSLPPLVSIIPQPTPPSLAVIPAFSAPPRRPDVIVIDSDSE